MAITITQSPQTYTPIYNEAVYVVDSTAKAQPNFKYICDVYLLGAATYVTRLKAHPDPVNGFGVFDVHKVIESYVTHDISVSAHGFQRNANSYKNFQCKFGEEYGLSSSGTTVYPNLSTASTVTGMNAVLDFQAFQSYTYTDYVQTGSRPFLTNAPATQYIRSDQNAWVYMWLLAPIVDYMLVKTYDSSNNIIQTVRVTTGIGAFGVDDRTYRFGCGTRNLNLISSGSITLGAQPIITSSVAKYTIQAVDTLAATASALYTYNIDSSCARHDVYRLLFLNEKGGFDSFNFTAASREESEIQRSQYKKILGSLSGAGAYSYQLSDRGKVQYATSIDDKLILNSDWISEEESAWLRELVESPEVYIDNGSSLLAINITNSKYETKKEVNEKLFLLTLEIEYSYKRYRQRY